jgi:NTP pyrophosphatase (non-canonical NTP hydrolase)
MQDLLKRIAYHYGYESQSIQLVEECAELIQAVSKYRRATAERAQPLADYRKTLVLENLIEEIADVEIMLAEVKILLDISEGTLDTIKQFKLQRTINRMAGK